MRPDLPVLIKETEDLQFFFRVKETEMKTRREELVQRKEQLLILDAEAKLLVQVKEFLLSLNTAVQQKVKDRIQNLMTLALQDVFGYPYQVRLDFSIKRNQSEISISVVDGEMELSPDEELGGGIVDILSFSLRVILWFMTTDKTDAILILDEPFKNLSAEYQPNASALLRRLSEMFGIQFLIVTHETLLEHSADRVFLVSRKDKVSGVQQVVKDVFVD